MIDMRKHDSRDILPGKPFFKGSKGKKNYLISAPVPVIDPLWIFSGKWIHLCTQCMDQLEKWHCLLEKGIISEEQYKELQGNILGDLRSFNSLYSSSKHYSSIPNVNLCILHE